MLCLTLCHFWLIPQFVAPRIFWSGVTERVENKQGKGIVNRLNG